MIESAMLHRAPAGMLLEVVQVEPSSALQSTVQLESESHSGPKATAHEAFNKVKAVRCGTAFVPLEEKLEMLLISETTPLQRIETRIAQLEIHRQGSKEHEFSTLSNRIRR